MAGKIKAHDLAATGTRDGTKFLRDDDTWQVPGGGVSDGDKGDIVVSSSGAVWTLEEALKKDAGLNIYNLLGGSIKGETLWSIKDIVATASLSSTSLRYIAIYLPVAATLTGVKWFQSTQGNYTGSNYNGVGLYSYSAGTLTLEASSTNDTEIWKGASNSWQSKAFSSTYAASAGLYFVGLLYSQSAQTTQPQIGASSALLNGAVNPLDFTNSGKISASDNNAQTAFPTPRSLANAGAVNQYPYVAVY